MFVYVHYIGPNRVQLGYLFTKAMSLPFLLNRPIVHRHDYVPRKIASGSLLGLFPGIFSANKYVASIAAQFCSSYSPYVPKKAVVE